MNNKEFERYDTTIRKVQFEEVGKYEPFIKTIVSYNTLKEIVYIHQTIIQVYNKINRKM